ncbi:MAG: hypothetical protein KF773_03745 [Deltaproteobacteria bacterium]|nr:hypothetical protein [Deltaproteobacteria bacterium]MCW5807738.1 hypothetical protein [Deltaproteobacteria bacterium]
MNKLAVAALAIWVGCGDGGTGTPDAPVEPDAPVDVTFQPGCMEIPQTGPNMFAAAADFGQVVAGSLAAWEPDGRWFLTGTRVGGVSSFHIQKLANGIAILDRDTDHPGTIDANAVFQRATFEGGGETFILAKRVANLLPDGSLRADRAVCDGQMCRVCTARMIRATHLDGEGEGQGLVKLSELRGATWGPGFTFNVRVAGTLAYLIRQDGLHIIETADPEHPVELGKFRRAGDGYSNDVKIVDAAGGKRFAIIADFPVDIVDVTNPAAPVLAGQIAEEAHTLFTETRNGQTRAYFGNYDGSCPVYDVTNPAAPQRLGRYQSPGSIVHDLSVADGVAYLDAWEAGLIVVDFNNPAQPTVKGTWAPTPTETSHSNWTTVAGGRRIALHGEESYGAHLDVVDIDPASATFMQPFASWKTRDWVSIHNIMAFGEKAYFTHYQDGIRVLDLSNPAQPTQVGYYNTWDPQAAYTTNQFFEGAVGLDVDLARKLVFVADSPRGLIILRDDTP